MQRTSWHRLAVGGLVLILLISPWILGGRIKDGQLILGLGAWSVFALYLVGLKNWSFRGITKYAWGIWSNWIALFIVLGVSVWNTSHEIFVDEAGVSHLWKIGAIDSLPSSIYGWRTFQHAFFLTSILVLSYSAYHLLQSRREIIKLLRWIFLNSIVLAVAGIVVDAIGSEKIFTLIEPNNASFFSSFHYHNHWGVYGLIGITCGLVLWQLGKVPLRETQEINRHALYGSGFFVLSFSIFLAGGRLCLLGLSILLGAYLVWWIWTSQYRWLGMSSLLGVLGILLLVSGERLHERVEQTIIQAQEISEGNLSDTRFYAAPRDTIRMAMEKPIWGWGVGSYRYAFRQFAGPEFYIPHRDEIVLAWMEAAHNDWLQVWAELGVVGMILLFAVPIGFFIYCWQRGRPHLASFRIMCLLVVIGLIACLDFPMANPAIAIHVWVLGALAGKLRVLERLHS